MDAALLIPLTDRVAAMAAPSGMHPAVRRIADDTDAWARGHGLVTGDPDDSPLGRARFARLAGSIFPEADEERVALFARWLVWSFAFDDAVDDTALGRSATSVDELYGDLLRALRRGHPRPEARPLESALADLWRATAPGRGRAWRHRFLAHMEDHRTGCAEEAVDRRLGRTPDMADYPVLRRKAAGPFLYDLVAPVLGVEPPDDLVGGPAWKALAEGTSDMIAWSNDVVSYRKETSRGDTHNRVSVVCASYGFEPEQATSWVVDHIAHRAGDVQAAARAVGTELDRLRTGPAGRSAAAAVVRCLVDAPRAHLDWLLESGRYDTACAPVPFVPIQQHYVRPAAPTSASPESVRT